jgi:hypothetical protein
MISEHPSLPFKPNVTRNIICHSRKTIIETTIAIVIFLKNKKLKRSKKCMFLQKFTRK